VDNHSRVVEDGRGNGSNEQKHRKDRKKAETAVLTEKWERCEEIKARVTTPAKGQRLKKKNSCEKRAFNREGQILKASDAKKQRNDEDPDPSSC